VRRAWTCPERTAYCWHGFLRGIKGGQRYGFRVHGPWGPQGHRCNPAKLLVDPYARAITGDINYGTELCPDKYHGANASWG
jgi:isoamylase